MTVRAAQCPHCGRRVWLTWSVTQPLYIAHCDLHAHKRCAMSEQPYIQPSE